MSNINRVDLNCDLGESFGVYSLGMDDEIIPLISSCNIACGFHASDPLTMQKTVELAAKAGIGIGAHPGLPDLLGFGRRQLSVTPKEAAAYITYQVGALSAFVKACGLKLQHVKPHGALYNMAAKDYDLSLAMAKAVQKIDPDLIFMALAGSQTIKACKDIGLPFAQEVFADRAYCADGSLVSRLLPGAVISDDELAARRVIQMITKKTVTAIDGSEISIQADSVCVHGDNAHALEVVRKLRTILKEEDISILPLSR